MIATGKYTGPESTIHIPITRPRPDTSHATRPFFTKHFDRYEARRQCDGSVTGPSLTRRHTDPCRISAIENLLFFNVECDSVLFCLKETFGLFRVGHAQNDPVEWFDVSKLVEVDIYYNGQPGIAAYCPLHAVYDG